MSFWKWFTTRFHRHEWEVYREMPLTIYETGFVADESRVKASGVRYVLRCKICGEMKWKDML
jgi:hypothetical protein